MKQKNETDILVIGGGTPGLALACLLGQAGLSVTIAEKFPAPPLEKTMTDTRTTALMDGSVNILKATGAWDAASPFAAALQTLRIIDDSGKKPVEIAFKAAEAGLPQFGFNIPNAPLRAALAETAQKTPRIRMIQASLSTYKADDFGVSATFDDGSILHAKLIVGADGRDSVTRETSQIQVWAHDYQQKAITCLIDSEKHHAHVSTEFHRPSGPFTLVPLPGENRASIVWVDFNEKIDEFMALSPHAFERLLQEKSAGLLGKIRLADNVPPRCWPLKALRAKRLTACRMALIAEAAHVIHPIGAQGLNLSLRDVAALAETIIDAARNGQDIGSRATLDTYERHRKTDIQTRVLGTHGLNRIVSNGFALPRTLRHLGLRTLDTISPLRALAMQQGLAPQKEESRLARGEAL